MALFLVTGPPAAGKTTWIQERARPGDITIDYDTLTASLTPDSHDTPTVRAVTKAARQAAINEAVRHADRVDVYVIHAMPSARTIDHYQALGAQLVIIDPGPQTVLARCRRERPWQMTQAAKEWYASKLSVVASKLDPAASKHPATAAGADATRTW